MDIKPRHFAAGLSSVGGHYGAVRGLLTNAAIDGGFINKAATKSTVLEAVISNETSSMLKSINE